MTRGLCAAALLAWGLLAGAAAADPPALPGKVVARVEHEPDWLAPGFGSLWLVSYEPGALHRLDSKTGKVVASAPTGGKSCQRTAIAFGRVWVADCKAGLLLGLDPRTMAVDRRFALPLDPKREGAIAAAGGDLWITVAPSAVARVDPKTGAVKATIPLPAGASGVAEGFGAVWVSSTDAAVLSRVDLKANAVTATIKVSERPRFLAVGAGAVWAMHLKNAHVTRLDPASNTVAAEIATGTPETDCGDIAFGAGAVWTPVEGRPLTRIDPATNRVTHSYAGGQSTAAMTVAFGAAWISDYDRGELWKVALADVR
jgi:virginiamycin B lyase